METRIQKTLCQWFPDAFDNIVRLEFKSDYDLLHHFAKYTKKLVIGDCENKSEPFKIIALLYFKGTLFEKNAIENEFLSVIALEENTNTLKEHLELMPELLRSVYLKTILEN
jgi:hypothetical protein